MLINNTHRTTNQIKQSIRRSNLMLQAVLKRLKAIKEAKILSNKAWLSLRMKKRLANWRNPNLMWDSNRKTPRKMAKVQKCSISTKTSEIIKNLIVEVSWTKNSNSPKLCGHLKMLQICTIKAMRIKIRACHGFRPRISRDSKTPKTVIYKGVHSSRIPVKIKTFSSSRIDNSLQLILTIFQSRQRRLLSSF